MSHEFEFDPAKLEPLLRPGFVFGAATAAYQIEGAASEDGRSDSVWDVFCRQRGNIRNGDSGDIACDHYHRWQQDVSLLSELGVDAYRFSISWSRILPADSAGMNQKGMAFYQRLVDELLSAGIRPLVTLHHWDLPQYLQEQGGWTQRRTAARFAEFAELVATQFGKTVDFYTTINEPWCVAFLGHRLGVHAPGIQDDGAAFAAAHHLLLGHGMAVRALRRCAPHAEVGIVLNGGPCHAASPSGEDAAAALLAETEQIHLFADALLKKEYPEALARKTAPCLQPGDLDVIGECCDYLGWNYYTRNVVRAAARGTFELLPFNEFPLTDMGWEVYPEGLREVLESLDRRYDLPPLYVTENGSAFPDSVVRGAVHDVDRIAYLQSHLRIVADLVSEGFDIRGYVCWSLMDNFEWAEGYSKRFGLVHVDYETQERIVKESGRAFARLMSCKASL